MDWTTFLLPLLGSSLTGLIVGIYFNRSLERLKGQLQRDTFKFSKWHERRVDAVVAIYEAFETHLEFLRKHLYWEGDKGPVDQIHDFPKAISKQIMFLDDALAEEVVGYQAQLFSFWNETVGGNKVAAEETRHRLDHELPAILPKLRRAINKSMDPQFPQSGPGSKHRFLSFMEAGMPKNANK